MQLSIILPIYNEEGDIKRVYQEIKTVLDVAFPNDYEIIAINDGSQDGTSEILKEISRSDEAFKVINFRRNYGQTAAISAGIDYAQGEVLVPMDADYQNDPADIPKLFTKLHEGYDVVSGWRKSRQDKWIRRIPSHIANSLISYITKVKLHDYGCTLKAYRKELVKEIRLYGEMHRFIPAYVVWQGGKVAEIVVNHRPRERGKAKYGFSRIFKVILDLITVKFLFNYLTKPIYFFGQAGLILFLFGLVFGIASLVQKFAFGMSLINSRLPLLTVLFIIIGVQFILMGILAEILTRIYYESQSKKTSYTIKEKINFKDDANS